MAGILAAVSSAIMSAISQRPFWSETQIRELVSKKLQEQRHHLFANPMPDGILSSNFRAMRIFATEEQQTWLLVDTVVVVCVLDDRRWQEPLFQWQRRLSDCLPVHAEADLSDEAGALQFGNMTKKWLYSKDLFRSGSATNTVTTFLSGTDIVST
jgi:hypothetical protein